MSFHSGVVTEQSNPSALDRLFTQIDAPSNSLNLLFFSDPTIIESRLKAGELPPNTIGCSSANLLPMMDDPTEAIVGIGLGEDEFLVDFLHIDNLDQFDSSQLPKVTQSANEILNKHHSRWPHAKSLGILLIDGYSKREETTVGVLKAALEDVPIVGGSASNPTGHEKTLLLQDGELKSNCATLVIITTTRDFKVYKSHNFRETNKKLVITKADPKERIVYEIDGRPAAESYALALGLGVQDLTDAVYARHPLMLKVADEYYIRSMQMQNEDQSLQFFCAIENGLVLTIAEPECLHATTAELFKQLEKELGPVEMNLSFECMLRQREKEAWQVSEINRLYELFRSNQVIGFSTFGEQFGGLHINQTITGVAFGKQAG